MTTITATEAQLVKDAAELNATESAMLKARRAAQLASDGSSLVASVARRTGLDRDRLELIRVRRSLVDDGRVIGVVRHVGTGRTVRVIGEDRLDFTYTTRVFRRLPPSRILNRLVG